MTAVASRLLRSSAQLVHAGLASGDAVHMQAPHLAFAIHQWRTNPRLIRELLVNPLGRRGSVIGGVGGGSYNGEAT